MNITLANNLKKLRLAKNLTQEDLAGYLGISFQAVSKWEREEGFPDITMLPIIANYFGISIDTLLGNDAVSVEDKIRNYCDEYERYNVQGKMDEAVAVAKQAYHDFPYDWRVIDIYCRALTRGYSEHPGDKLPELRSICQMIIDKCTDAKIRMHAVYSMLFAEDDEYVEKWFAEVPETYDFSEWERREERYYDRGQTDKFRAQKQENMYQLYSYLREKLTFGVQSPEENIMALRYKIAVTNALFNGENLKWELFTHAYSYIKLASLLFEVGEKTEGYEVLEKGISLCEEYLSIPVGTELCGVGIFDTIKRKMKYDARTRAERAIMLLAGERKLSGFTFVSDDKEYQNLVKRVERYL